MAARELRHQVEELEDATWRALQHSGADLFPYLTADCIMQFPLGMKLTATTEPSVQDILHSSAFIPWKSFKFSKVDVTPIGPDGAVISYLVIATRPPAGPESGDDVPFEALCSSVWRMDRGKLRMCFHQQTLTA